MIKTEIQSIINAGEGLKTEFKESKSKLPMNLFESVCAFLNTKGGIILLGISDNGKIIGINKTVVIKLKKDIANLANNPEKLSPVIFLKIDEFVFNDKIILSVEVPESSQVHKTNNNIFVRNQDGDYKVFHPVEIAKIVNRKQNYHSEQRIFPQVSFSDFNPELIDKAKQLIKLNNFDNHLWELNNKEFLSRVGFYKKNEDNLYGYSLAAILFFGTDELIQSVVPAYKFEALVRKHNIDRYDDRLTIRTNLIDSYDLLMSFIEKHLNDPFYLEGTTRINLRSKIFRELVSNIISHREYMSPQPAFINIFKDRIEFINPNNPTVFGKIDPKHFTPVAKNPTINKLMIQMGRAEDIGSGIRNVSKYLPHYAQNTSFEFIDNDLFSTIIYLDETTPTGLDKVTRKTRGKTREKIIELMINNPEITIEQIEKLTDLSRRGVEWNIDKLKKEGIIKRVGSRKKGKWVVIT